VRVPLTLPGSVTSVGDMAPPSGSTTVGRAGGRKRRITAAADQDATARGSASGGRDDVEGTRHAGYTAQLTSSERHALRRRATGADGAGAVGAAVDGTLPCGLPGAAPVLAPSALPAPPVVAAAPPGGVAGPLGGGQRLEGGESIGVSTVVVRQIAASVANEMSSAMLAVVNTAIAANNAVLCAPGGPLEVRAAAVYENAAAAAPPPAQAVPPDTPWAEKSFRAIGTAVEASLTVEKMQPEVNRSINIAISMMARTADTQEDVLTAFTPTMSKRQGNKSHCVKWGKVVVHMVADALVAKELAQTEPAPVFAGLVDFRASSPCRVGDVIVSHVATFMNQGRFLSRKVAFREVGFFVLCPSPLVYIRAKEPNAPRPDKRAGAGSPYFAVETSRLASYSGTTSAPPSFPPALETMARAAALGARDVDEVAAAVGVAGQAGGGGGSGAGPVHIGGGGGNGVGPVQAAGGDLPGGAGGLGQQQLLRDACLYDIAEQWLMALSDDKKAKHRPSVTFHVAVSFRKMVVEERWRWTTEDGLRSLTLVDKNSPCQWWLLFPSLGLMSRMSKVIQTLDQSAINVIEAAAVAQLAADAIAAAESEDEEEAGLGPVPAESDGE